MAYFHVIQFMKFYMSECWSQCLMLNFLQYHNPLYLSLTFISIESCITLAPCLSRRVHHTWGVVGTRDYKQNNSVLDNGAQAVNFLFQAIHSHLVLCYKCLFHWYTEWRYCGGQFYARLLLPRDMNTSLVNCCTEEHTFYTTIHMIRQCEINSDRGYPFNVV